MQSPNPNRTRCSWIQYLHNLSWQEYSQDIKQMAVKFRALNKITEKTIEAFEKWIYREKGVSHGQKTENKTKKEILNQLEVTREILKII